MPPSLPSSVPAVALAGAAVVAALTIRRLVMGSGHVGKPMPPPPRAGFAPKTVLVVGAGSGLGRATALALLEAGHAVVGADIDLPALLRLEREVKTLPGHFVTLAMNVANAASVQEAAARLVRFSDSQHCLYCI